MPKYKGVGDQIQHINKHKASLLRKNFNNNHIVLLFPSSLLAQHSHGYSTTPTSVNSLENLKMKFIQWHMTECQFMNHVVAVNNIKQNQSDTLSNFYGQFHKGINKFDQQIGQDKICHVFHVGLNPLKTAPRSWKQLSC